MDMIPNYCRNKHNPRLTTYDHPLLEPILKETYGQIVYQEQVMEIFKQLGGYSLGQADMVRRAMGKKKTDEMAKQKKIFINGDSAMGIAGAVANGVPKDVAANIFAKMEKFAGYAFNKSHAACYAFLAYQTAYLKYYYYSFFMASMLNNRINKWEDMTHYIAEMRAKNAPILPPDINRSESVFTVELNADAKDNPIQPVRFGLSAIKNVGEGIVGQIIAERNAHGEYRGFIDFCQRVPAEALNKRCLESLILSGSFDRLKLYRSQLMSIYPTVVKLIASEKEAKASGQMSLFGPDFGTNASIDIEIPKINEYSGADKLKFEREYVGLYLSGHPLYEYAGLFNQYTFNTGDIKKQQDGDDESDPPPASPAYPANSPDPFFPASPANSANSFAAPAHSNDPAYFGNSANPANSANSSANPDCSDDDDGGFASAPAAKKPETVTFGAIICEIKKIYTRANREEMAVLTVEDLFGTCSVMVFPKIWAKIKPVIAKDIIVGISGRLSARDGEDPIILAENITPLTAKSAGKAAPDEPEPASAVKKLYLRFNLSDAPLKSEIMKILSAYSGDLAVVIKDTAAGNVVSPKLTVRECRAVIYELNSLIGEENVVLR
jgi:DNA polymerase III alpha subunit